MKYLASPYSTTVYTVGPLAGKLLPIELTIVRNWRAQAAYCTMAYLQAVGENVYSPIAHNNQADDVFRHFLSINEASEFEHYQRWDEHMIDISEGVIVLELPGWRRSRGVLSEIQYAKNHDKPILYMDLPPPVEALIGLCPYAQALYAAEAKS